MIKYLLLRHELVGDLFALPETPADWRKNCLTPSQVEFYRQNGYLPGMRLLSDEQVAALREELATLVDPSYPGNQLFYEFHGNEAADKTTVLFHALGAWRITPAFHDMLWNPAFTVPASQLLDGAVRFWHDQLFCKPARHGGVVAWHQDYSYWTRTKPIAHLTCWIALDDATAKTAACTTFPAATAGRCCRSPAWPATWTPSRPCSPSEQKAQFQPVPVEFPKGHATFHHPLTVHGSYANRSDRPRRGLVINVFRDGVVSDSDEPLLKGVPPVPRAGKWTASSSRCCFDPQIMEIERKSNGGWHA